MAEVGTHRVPCEACAPAPIRDRKHCRECGGLGYLEITVRPENCTGQQPECPVFADPMVGGWECRRCGASGPL